MNLLSIFATFFLVVSLQIPIAHFILKSPKVQHFFRLDVEE